MTDQTPKELLLQSVETEQNTIAQPTFTEETEHVTAPQLILKSGDSFLITDVSGDLLASQQEMGLFRHGTRFLRTCNLYLEGQKLITLSYQTSEMSETSHTDLTNAPITTAQHTTIEQGTIHVDRFLELEQDYLVQTLTITNFHLQEVDLTFSLKVGADFADLFEIRGMTREQRGTQLPPQTSAQDITLRYQGLDDIERLTRITLEPSATHVQADRADWNIHLEQGQQSTIRITIAMGESTAENLQTEPAANLWRETAQPTVLSNDAIFNQWIKRGLQDLMMLSTMTPHGYYPYAGIPWFCAPFGRDGLIAALEYLPWFPQVARGTLEFLATYQGKKIDPFTDEEPGKILHEFRTGEMANLREIPFIPYYGTVDATPLFLILFEAYLRWTGDKTFLSKLWPHAQDAAEWMIKFGDKDGDGFLEYHTASEKGLRNQGWKDSGDSIHHQDGRLAHSPIALSEVQGYAYAAYQAMSYLANQQGLHEEAQHWEHTANELQSNFLRHYWWEEENTFYEGLADQKEPCDVVSSNAGHCLWSGIVPDELAQKMITRLMQEDMFSGWGIRTLSTQARRYNPMSYHNGSVWPHDTAIIGAGIARYGEKRHAATILKSLYDASSYFADARLPELYCGFDRREGFGPTLYPTSCSPQAWAAGSPFLLLNGLLGLAPNATEHCLTLHQPTLPSWLDSLELRGLFVGSRRVHLRFIRVGEQTEVVLGKENEIDIRVL